MRCAILLTCLLSFSAFAGEPKTYQALVLIGNLEFRIFGDGKSEDQKAIEAAAAKCGVQESGLKEAALATLVEEGFSSADEAMDIPDFFVVVRAFAGRADPDFCAASISVIFMSPVHTALPWQDEPHEGAVLLCEVQSMHVGADQLAGQTAAAVKKQTRECIRVLEYTR
jgi:hypothetical protein